MRQFVPWACAVLCLVLPAMSAEGGADEGPALRVVLFDAAEYAGVPGPGSPAVLIEIERVGGRWKRGWAASRAFGNEEREVRVDAADLTADRMELALTVSEPRTEPAPGERFRYAVSVAKGADGRFHGAYTGTLRGAEVKGGAAVEVSPPERTAPQYRPLEPGEHPRLLFRRDDVAALREKAKTPFGKRAMEKMPDSAAGLAMRYQITSDASLAAQAAERVKAIMADIEHGDKRVRSRWFGLRLEQAALAYDMCYDAWPADFRKTVAEYLLDQVHILFYERGRGVFDSHISWDLGFSHGPPILYGGAMAALAIRGEKGPKPERPEPPYALRTEGGVIEPPKGYQPGRGVEAADLESGVMPRTWIYAGAFPQGQDHLAAVGGPAGVRPHVGMQVTSGGVTAEFRPIDEGKGYLNSSLTGGQTMLELTGPAGVVKYSMGYFYAVLRSGKDQWVRFDTDNGSVEGYLGGVRIAPGEVVRLRSGLYPLLVTSPIDYIKPWGKTFMRPRLTVLTEAEARALVAAEKAEYDEQLKDWAYDVDLWERSGGGDPRFLNAYELTRFIESITCRELPGTGGMALPGDELLTLDGLNKYAMAHRTAMGCDITPYEDIAAFLPYKMFVHTFRSDGKALGLEANGPAGFASAYYPDNSRSTLTDSYATLFPLVREEWQPAALWAWQYHTRGDGDGDAMFDAILTTGRRSGWAYAREYGTFDTEPLYAFVSYPAKMEAKPPQGVMPLTWQAPGGGFYGFRNNWSGTDDEIITHFYSHTPGGGAGTVRLIGLGAVWSHGLSNSAPARYGENVVQLPDDDVNEGARGKVVCQEAEADGSGVLTLDLGDVYTAPKYDERDRAESLYTKYGGYRRPAAFVDQGITGLRALGVDYSGKSGAPCVLVMVDTLKGGGEKLWTWQIESKREAGPPTTRVKADVKEDILFDGKQFKYKIGQLLKREVRRIDDDPMVRVTEDGFTLTQGGATLRATFVAPARPEVELAERVEYRQGVKSGVARNSSKAIFAKGGDAFFVVLTLQHGPAPEVKVEGKGLGSRVTVGGQTIRFDGQRVIFGD